ncbi:single-stranded DNA-binding protein [Microbacterium sp. NPDC006705]|uniref:single-stranded DNA-binding protein n=1 Tax=Microbacterium TaxID=33882 RepID=UPI0022B05FB9|nr:MULTISPECIES: single-stranded DNA-binding protein [Microbacterium]MCZ4069090.1 single-stranded DNA-binding protein [Microbacterium sp. H37-C3]WHE37841.1 single-stranded DNA-binding protein [Microbacterium sp. BDGP8]WRK17155.1 single-stranded DNA-binding protein [Microbacterium plantarum]
MSTRFITGRLSADPEVQQAGRIQITKFTVLENTYEYRGEERIEGHQPLAHYVEAKFELGANAASSLHKGDAVIVVGAERDASFGGREGTVYRRIIDASAIGPDLAHATATVDPIRRAPATAAPASAES